MIALFSAHPRIGDRRHCPNVQLIGFGSFKIATRKARMGVNPKTGAKIKIKASKTVKFLPGAAFKKIL